MPVSFRHEQGGILRVVYAASEDLAPESNQALRTEISEVGRRGRFALVFELASEIHSVPLDVPSFWLRVTAEESRLAAMAIVSGSRAVKVAARGFAIANRVRGLDVAVDAFPAVDDALAWTRRLLEG